MGKLIINHLARLLTLSTATLHLWTALLSFFFPKILWDPYTTLLNPLAKPVPVLSIVNLLLAMLVIALEWPLPWLVSAGDVDGGGGAGRRRRRRRRALHASFELRLLGLLPLAALAAGLGYWGLDVFPGYLLGMVGYAWAWCRGEVRFFLLLLVFLLLFLFSFFPFFLLLFLFFFFFFSSSSSFPFSSFSSSFPRFGADKTHY